MVEPGKLLEETIRKSRDILQTFLHKMRLNTFISNDVVRRLLRRARE